jgi:hemolysin activation/secretion protein
MQSPQTKKKSGLVDEGYPPRRMNPRIVALLVALLPLTSQGAEQAAPTAGSILQQMQPIIPVPPSNTETGLVILQGNGVSLPPTAPFNVKSLQLSGNTVFDTASLHALVAWAEGKELTLPQLGEAVSRITDYYHEHGYPLARAIIPAQTIQQGVVRIEVIEARYGKIHFDNHSRVDDGLLRATLTGLQPGQQIEQKALDHSLLLLTDIAGVGTTAALKSGETARTSDLLIEANETPVVYGNAALDDYGNRYTGRIRLAATVNVIDPFHHGDVLSANALTTGRDMDDGTLSYDTLLNGAGTHVGGSLTALHYILGDTISSIDGHGTAQVESLWIRHPFQRNREINLYGQLQVDHKELKDEIDTSNVHTDRHLNSWTASLSGDLHDTLLSGGVNTWDIAWMGGRMAFDNAAAQLADAQTARTQGAFAKWNVNLARLQTLGQNNALYFMISSQWANSNLDTSEKMVAGGPYTVRAYDIGAVSGDSGLLASVELRHDLGQHWDGQWQAVAFFDSEHVTVNHNLWAAAVNDSTMSGVGAGLNWAGTNRWHVKAYVATPVGPSTVLAGANKSMHAWMEIGRGF